MSYARREQVLQPIALEPEIHKTQTIVESLDKELIQEFEARSDLSAAQIRILNAITLIQKIDSKILHCKGRSTVVSDKLDLGKVKLVKITSQIEREDTYLFCPIPYISFIINGVMSEGIDFRLASNIMTELYLLTDTKSIEFTPEIISKRGSNSGLYYNKKMVDLAMNNFKKAIYIDKTLREAILNILTYLNNTFMVSRHELIFDIGEDEELKLGI